jgi:hypothetical protein
MLAVLRLELIADNEYQHKKLIERGKAPHPHLRQYVKILCDTPQGSRPWCARLIGLDPQYGFKREFQRGQKDYSRANSVGSRGVFVYYPLKPGIYEVNERLTWKRMRRYFIHVEGVEITEISREEVLACLTNTA